MERDADRRRDVPHRPDPGVDHGPLALPLAGLAHVELWEARLRARAQHPAIGLVPDLDRLRQQPQPVQVLEGVPGVLVDRVLQDREVRDPPPRRRDVLPARIGPDVRVVEVQQDFQPPLFRGLDGLGHVVESAVEGDGWVVVHVGPDPVWGVPEPQPDGIGTPIAEDGVGVLDDARVAVDAAAVQDLVHVGQVGPHDELGRGVVDRRRIAGGIRRLRGTAATPGGTGRADEERPRDEEVGGPGGGERHGTRMVG
jgi:hypothetical protein